MAKRAALVTGGSSGIGLAIARALGEDGYGVTVSARRPEKLEEAAEGLRADGLDVLSVPAMMGEEEQIVALVEAHKERFGRLDVLVNNAGGQFPQAAIDFPDKGWAAVINNNLNGTWYMMQRAARYWREHGTPGAIVNVVVVTERGMPGVAHTVAARSGVVGLTRTVAVEWAPLNIRVNCLAPGLTATEGLDVYPPEARREFPRANPMRRPGTPMEIAEGLVYLAGPSASFVTGEVLTVDGGGKLWGELWTAGRPEYFGD